MSYTFLQEQGEESSAGCFSDIEPFVRSRLNLTAEKFSCNDSETESCLGSRSGTMCEPSTESRGEALQMLCAEGSPVRISPSLGDELASTERAAGSSGTSLIWPVDLIRDGSCWRTCQDSLLTMLGVASDPCSLDWTNSGTWARGRLWMRAGSESRSDAAGSSSLRAVLELETPERFSLSAKAASGILRRAERRGRTLPEPLAVALRSLAAGDVEPTRPPGGGSSSEPSVAPGAQTTTTPKATASSSLGGGQRRRPRRWPRAT